MKWPWALALVVVSGCALFKQLTPAERPVGMAASAERVGPGQKVLVGSLGVQEVLKDVRANLERLGALAPDGGVQDGGQLPDDLLDFHRCLLNPASYEVWVQPGDAGGSWLVIVLPKGWCHEGAYGGGGEFEIDGASLELLRRESYE